MTDHLPKTDSRPWAVPAGLLIGAVLTAVLIGAFAWQNSERDSKLTEAVAHADAAVFLQEAASEGNIAADLLGTYVLEGDESLIPQIQDHSTAALAGLTGALSGSDSDAIRQIAVEGAGLSAGAGSVIALRQAGDVEGAGAVLAGLATDFLSFGTAMQAAIDTELATAVSLTNSSQTADDTASWLLIAGIVIASVTGAAFLFIASRSVFKRRAPEKPSPA